MKKKQILLLSLLIVLIMLISCAPSTKQVLATEGSKSNSDLSRPVHLILRTKKKCYAR